LCNLAFDKIFYFILREREEEEINRFLMECFYLRVEVMASVELGLIMQRIKSGKFSVCIYHQALTVKGDADQVYGDLHEMSRWSKSFWRSSLGLTINPR